MVGITRSIIGDSPMNGIIRRLKETTDRWDYNWNGLHCSVVHIPLDGMLDKFAGAV